MDFERYAQLNGLNWHSVGPIHVMRWLQEIRHFEASHKARLLAQLSDAFDSIGASDPTRSSLVTKEMSDHWDLKPPRSWTAKQIDLWRTLPYQTAKLITDKRADDVKVIRQCQHLNAYLTKHADKDAAVNELTKEMNKSNAKATPAA